MEKSDFSVFWSDEDNAFIATCAKHPGLSAFGSTEEQAIHEAKIGLSLIEAELEPPRAHPRIQDAAEAILRRYQGMSKDELLAHARKHRGTDLEKLMQGLAAADRGDFATPEEVAEVFAKYEKTTEEKKEKCMTEKRAPWQWQQTPSDSEIRPFITLPLHKRRDECVALGNKIRQGTHKFGGSFHAPEVPEGTWADFFFLGQTKGVLWNASAITLHAAREQAAEEMAWDMALAKLPEDVRDDAWRDYIFGKLNPEKELGRLEFGGNTLGEYLEEIRADILANNPPRIEEHFGVEIEYFRGIGLTMVLDVPEMSTQAIEDGIRKFRVIESEVLSAVMEKVAR
jgi:predicted transcriptional regulator